MEIGEGEIMRKTTPLERVDMYYPPEKVQRPTEEDQILDQYFRNIQQDKQAKEIQEEIKFHAEFLNMTDEELRNLPINRPEVKLTPEQQMIRDLGLKQMVKDFQKRQVWPTQPIFVIKEKAPEPTQPRQESREVLQKVLEEENQQLATAQQYIELVSDRAKRMGGGFFRPKICAYFYNAAKKHCDQYARWWMKNSPFATSEAFDEDQRQYEDQKGLALSWYKRARAEEEGMFHYIRMLTKQDGKPPTDLYNGRDMEMMNMARFDAERALKKTFFINLDELKI